MGKKGKVWLVGAGPGDPGLMTQRGLDALRRADVILYDRLVHPVILLKASPHAVWVDAGKTPRGRRMEQKEIHRLLISHAAKGKRVVRLKGGDPFIFGRGGEEAEALVKAKIPFEVIPGVTAGIAGPAYAGIPVTQRGISTELLFRIGARAEGSVRGKTLVGYMTVQGMDEFLERALDLGFTHSTPAGVIEWATTARQRVITGTIGTLTTLARRENISAPAIVVVGSVVSLRKKLKWWEGQVLAGKRIVLTASEILGKGWRECFEDLGAEVWEIPMTHIQPLTPDPGWISKIEKAQWLVFTSASAVRCFPKAVGDLRKVAGCKIAAVGKATADVLRTIGLEADWIGRGTGSDELVQGWPPWAKGRILHITGDAGDDSMIQRFRKRGYQADRIIIYRNQGGRSIPKPVQDALQKEGADWLVFASGTAAIRFRRLFPRLKKIRHVVAIGAATARAAHQAGWKVSCVAKEPSAQGVLRAMIKVS